MRISRAIFWLAVFAMAACSSSNPVLSSSSEDVSVEGAAVETIGGALAFSDPNSIYSYQNPPAIRVPSVLESFFATPTANAFSCGLPTTPAKTTCTTSSFTYPGACGSSGYTCATSGGNFNFFYGVPGFGFNVGCGFNPSGVPTWSGNMQWAPSPSSASCGTAINVQGITTLTRQFLDGAFSVSGTGARIAATGTTMNIDHTPNNAADPAGQADTVDYGFKTANAYGNFDGDAFPATPIAGCLHGCEQVSFSGGARTGVTFLQHLTAFNSTPQLQTDFTEFTGTLTGSTPTIAPLAVSESTSSATGVPVTTRTVTGTVTSYYNSLRIVGTVTFNGLTYNNTCCAPVSGTITTSFAAGAKVQPNPQGAQWVGKTEQIVISSCGVGTYTTVFGANITVNLTHCL